MPAMRDQLLVFVAAPVAGCPPDTPGSLGAREGGADTSAEPDGGPAADRRADAAGAPLEERAPWPMWRHDPGGRARSPSLGPLEPRLHWSVALGGPDDHVPPVVVAADGSLHASVSGRLLAIAATGEIRRGGARMNRETRWPRLYPQYACS